MCMPVILPTSFYDVTKLQKIRCDNWVIAVTARAVPATSNTRSNNHHNIFFISVVYPHLHRQCNIERRTYVARYCTYIVQKVNIHTLHVRILCSPAHHGLLVNISTGSSIVTNSTSSNWYVFLYCNGFDLWWLLQLSSIHKFLTQVSCCWIYRLNFQHELCLNL